MHLSRYPVQGLARAAVPQDPDFVFLVGHDRAHGRLSWLPLHRRAVRVTHDVLEPLKVGIGGVEIVRIRLYF